MALYRPCGCGKKSPKYKGHRDHHGSWYFDYYEGGRHGKHVRLNLGTEVRAEADIKVGEMTQDRRQGCDPALRVIKPRLFSEIVGEFKEKHVKMNIKERSRGNYERRIVRVSRSFDGKMIQQIDWAAIEDYKTARIDNVSKSTINREVSQIARILSWAKRRRYIAENPLERIGKFEEPKGKIRFLVETEADRLIDAAANHLRPIIITGLYTGGRVTELLTLKRDDIDLSGRVLTFLQTNTKSGKQREIPICDELMPTLRELMAKPRAITGHLFTYKGQPLQRFRFAFETARKRAHLGSDVTPHTLRHTFASWYRLSGGDLFDLMELMGHSDIKLTMRYAHISPEWKKARGQFIGRPGIPGRQNVDKIAEFAGMSKQATH